MKNSTLLLSIFFSVVFSFRQLYKHEKFRSKLYSKVPENGVRKYYANYVVYKGKAAVALKAIAPTWTRVGTGNSLSVSREGGLLFEFALATAPRVYDWSNKGAFLMDATECGELLQILNRQSLEMIHDPNAQTSSAGEIVKKMKWTIGSDCLYLKLRIDDKSKANNSESLKEFNIPITWGEFSVVETIIRDSIPKFLGFDKVWQENVVSDQEKATSDFFPEPPAPPAWKNM